MRKIALVLLSTLCAPTFAEEQSTKTAEKIQAIPEITKGTISGPSTVLSEAQEANVIGRTPEQIIQLIQLSDLESLGESLDYPRMHKAYLDQMLYISGKVDSLSEFVGSVAAGTFETRVREGSMMLGLISKQLKSVIRDTQGDPDSFKKFMQLKFSALSLPDIEFTHQETEGVILIEAKSPYSSSTDLIVLKRNDAGILMAVAFIPKEVEDVNNIVNGLMKRATTANKLGAELEKVALTQDDSS